MLNHALPAPNDLAGRIAAALILWQSDPDLADLASAKDDRLLVLDTGVERVLHAAPDVAGWISARDGRVRGTLDLAAQVRRLGALGRRPRLARLRLDTRGIAPLVTCRVARLPVDESGPDVVLVAVAGPIPRVRPPSEPERPLPHGSVASIADRHEDVTPFSPHRLLWRSDTDGILTVVSGPDRSVVDALRGRSWSILALEGERLLQALRDRGTVRALPMVVRLAGSADVLDLDVSGSQSGRGENGSAAYAGFALARARRTADASFDPVCGEAVVGGVHTEGDERSNDSGSDPETDQDVADRTDTASDPESPDVVATASPADPASLDVATSTAVTKDDETDVGPREIELEEATAAPRVVQGRSVPDLSVDERAAFREIARALGARFADDEPSAPDTAETAPALTVPTALDRGESVAAVLQNLPAGVLVHRDGSLLFANRRFLELTGFGGLSALRDAADTWRALLGEPGDGEPPTMTVSVHDGDASLHLVVERSTLDWDGAPAEILLARAAPPALPPPAPAEPATARSANGLPDAQVVLDRLEEGVVTLDSVGNVLALNPKAASILAGDTGEVVGKNFGALFGPDGTAAIDASLRQAREAGASEPREVSGGRGRDAAIPLRVRIARLLSVEESPLCATLQDLAPVQPAHDSEASKLREAEDDARRRLGYFAEAGQALRAPLGAMRGIADAMLAEQFGPLGSPRYREHLLDIRSAGGEALSLLEGLIDLAQIESGRLELSFADIRLNEIVATCIGELQPQAARERIVVRTSLSPEIGTLGADERALRRAVLATVAHAIARSDAGGQVIVSTILAERGEALLRVRGTGADMSGDEIERTLDPFGRGTPPGPSHAAGLGLALAKALVEANNGRMRITSRSGEGMLIEMAFPAAQAKSA